jgi:2-dehydro-3-deoxyphosphogluconate aldolase/(4S)-4-hydroxy-2-oxoglutarate aldolase
MARFTRIQVALKMAEEGMIPVFYNKDPEIGKKVIEACYNGGIRLFEFTNRGDYAHVVFEQLNRFAEAQFPDMILGTGSVVDAPTAVLYVQHRVADQPPKYQRLSLLAPRLSRYFPAHRLAGRNSWQQ